MRTAFIVYDRYMNPAMTEITIGGVQTYISALSQLMADIGMDVRIVQAAARRQTVQLPSAMVHGLDMTGRKRAAKLNHYREFVLTQRRSPGDLVIWATYYDAVPCDGLVSIGIQHGISFDYLGMESSLRKTLKLLGLAPLLKVGQRAGALRAFHRSRYHICVDYNFLNWYRTFRYVEDYSSICVIPNFADVEAEPPRLVAQFRRVIFARRFVEPRGTRLAIAAARHCLQKYADIEFTFAGEGELQPQIDELVTIYPQRVKIIRYCAEDSLRIHREHDIAIIPTLASEGTSLSLLEAMSAGCVAICTNVGGMTNIVIDRFNGLMINPDANDLIHAIETLYTDAETGNRLCANAQRTVQDGFSKQLWRQKWTDFFSKIASLEDGQRDNTVRDGAL